MTHCLNKCADLCEDDLLPELVNRFSCRQFAPDVALSTTQIRSLVGAAGRAPSGCNRQPWRFIIVHERERILVLSKFTLNQGFVKDASCVIVVLGDVSARRPEYTEERLQELVEAGAFSQEDIDRVMTPEFKASTIDLSKDVPNVLRDCTLAAYGLMLQATRMELASCWITIRDEEGLRKLCAIPEDLVLVCMLAIGKPATLPSNPRPRKNIRESTYVEFFGREF